MATLHGEGGRETLCLGLAAKPEEQPLLASAGASVWASQHLIDCNVPA